jgi:hypothetical protein
MQLLMIHVNDSPVGTFQIMYQTQQLTGNIKPNVNPLPPSQNQHSIYATRQNTADFEFELAESLNIPKIRPTQEQKLSMSKNPEFELEDISIN